MTRRLRFLLALTSLLAGGACAPAPAPQEPAPPSAGTTRVAQPAATGPRLVLEALAHDVGRVEAGTLVRHEFIVRNDGDAPLELEAKPTCGCTVTEVDELVAPGATGRLLAEMDTSSLQGPVNKIVHLITNDPETPRVPLRIRAEVVLGVRVLPEQRLQLVGSVFTMDSKTLELVSADGEPFDILSVSTEHDWLRTWIRPRPDRARPTAAGAKAEPREPAPGAVAGGHAAYELEVEAGEGASAGKFTDLVQLRTNHPKAPELQVLVQGDLDVGLVVEPKLLFFLARGETVQAAHVDVARQDRQALQLLGAETRDPALSTEIEALPGGHAWRVTVTRDTTLHEPGSVNEDELVLRTDHPERPELRIPIIAR